MPSGKVIYPESKIPLEKRVEWDMHLLGYDPTNPQDVREFWEDRKDTDELKILARNETGAWHPREEDMAKEMMEEGYNPLDVGEDDDI